MMMMMAVNNTGKKRSIAITAAGMAAAIAAIIAYVYVWRLQGTIPSSILAISFITCWLFGWQLDARLTAKNWQHVIKGGESNIFVKIIAKRITRGRTWLTLVLHAAFTAAVACALAAMLSVAISPLVPLDDPVAEGEGGEGEEEESSQGPAPMLFFVLASAFLVFFGAGHLDAYLANKEFVVCAFQSGDMK